MNYLAHALPFLGRPYFAAGTGVPDWLTVVDRKVRLRRKQLEPFLTHDDPVVAAVAGGARQHLADDARFHETRAFAECSLSLTVASRDALAHDAGMRPSFLGHLLVEVLLDAQLAHEDASRLDAYYATMAAVNPAAVEAAVNMMAARPTINLAPMLAEFCRRRILCDYLDDERLLHRLNQVMSRVGLPALPPGFAAVLPVGRRLIAARKQELLDGIPV